MRKGFTLIELLIVVAIIAILAAIAVPNFLEAQVRAKVSRAKSDMRTLATGIEAYFVDYNSYVPCNTFGVSQAVPFLGNDPILERLTSPIAFLANASLRDAFLVDQLQSAGDAAALAASTPNPLSPTAIERELNPYLYQAWNSTDRVSISNGVVAAAGGPASAWLTHSVGPDSTLHNLGGVLANDLDFGPCLDLMYDPTNGTLSRGSIYRTGGAASGSSSYAAGQGLQRAAAIAQ